MSCTGSAAGTYACPLGDQFACETPLSGGTPTCSPHECIDSATGGIIDEPIADDPGTPADGAVGASGECIGTIEIFSGRAVRCRPPGLKTSFSNCCKDKGKIVKDGMGS